MTPQAYKKYLFRHYEDMLEELVKNKDMSQACRTYIRSNLDMNLFSLIYNYKSNLSYAPMLSGQEGGEKGGHGRWTVPHTSRKYCNWIFCIPPNRNITIIIRTL